MKSLAFKDEAALQVALTSGLIPAELAATPAGCLRDAEGRLVVFPSKRIDRRLAQALAAAGVDSKPPARAPERRADCWAQLLNPRRNGLEPPRGPILFLAPPGSSCLDLGAQMLRLGCDRQEFRFSRGGEEPALLRAIDPPYYTLASALDGAGGMRAFAPSPPGQERVWTELGFSHPLASSLRAPDGQLLLVARDGAWLRLEDGPWQGLYEVLELEVPEAPLALSAKPLPARLQVRLRLAKASRNEPAALWVLRENAVEQMDALLRGSSDELVSRLLFAAAGDAANPIVILRARAARQGPPELELQGEAYVPLADASHVYLPRDATLEPPLRREKLRALLSPRPDEIGWLAPAEGDGFRLERIAESAFAPLSEWVDYLVHGAPELKAWARDATFDFAPFESIGAEWSDAPPKERREEERLPPKERSPRREVTEGPAQVAPAVELPRRRAEASAEEYRLAPTGEEERALHALEARFVELDAPADHPSRGELWEQMAHLHTRLGSARDAGLCWTRALWELPQGEGLSVAERWARAEAHLARQADPAALVPMLLAVERPTRDETRALAAQVVLAAHAPRGASLVLDAHRAQVWLDQHDDNLDVRSLWLARLSLAQLVSGDRLGLARARDRILAKLHRGLSLERDLPTFLRFLGHSRGRSAGGEPAQRLRTALEELLKRFERTERRRSAVEAPPALTRAYVRMVFAYGFARLGAADRARELRSLALNDLDLREPVHGFLARAYGARVEHAVEGLPVETPLPAPIQGELNALERFLRYKVDRLRQASSVLEPQERLDPVQGFQRGERDPRGEELAAMRGMTDPAALGPELERVMRLAFAAETPLEDRARLLDGAMDFLPVLPEAQALPRLSAVLGGLDDVPPLQRATLLEEALLVAGYFGRGDLARAIVVRIEKVLRALDPQGILEAGGTLGRCLRSLRRVGLREEAAELLDAVSSLVAGESPKALAGHLNVAAGLAYLGQVERAAPEFERAQKALRAQDLAMPDRLALTRACAGALSQAPQELAAKGIMQLAEQLPFITDSFNTNSHFCLSVVHFMESLVLGLASEDLALGEFGRRWLDEEEYLVRRRIQRDHAEAMG